jgi:hypothetical protein
MTGGGLMRIRNDYTGFSGKGYQDNYLYKNKEAAKENDSQADRTKPDGANTENTVYRKRESTYSRDGDTCQITHTVEKETPGENTHTGILKEFWNSLGDEGQTAGTGGQSLHLMAAFQNIKAAFQNFVKEHITEPVREFPQKIQKILGRQKEMPDSPADGKMAGEGGMPGHSEDGKEKKDKEWKPWEDEALGRMLHTSHLTDSYTRTGEYCNLSENVTYDSRRKRGQ